MTLATAASRLTGFLRVVVAAGALGTTFAANTYQTANTAPNVVFELVAAGVLTSIFVPTFVEHLVKDEREESWDTANVLTSVALIVLIGLSLLIALAAPLIMRLLTLGVDDAVLRSSEVSLGTDLLRMFAPQVVFYGVGMILTSALHAHRRFVLAALAPIFNNLVVIAAYLAFASSRGDGPPAVGGITGAQTLILGLGTTLGVVAMTVCLLPQLRKLGWRFRFRFEPRHPSVSKATRLGVWALSYAGGYQAGLIVVLLLANRIQGGVAAYQWAFTFFFVPHALFAIPIFGTLFPALAEDAARDKTEMLMTRLRDGIAMLSFFLIPIAIALVVVAEPLTRVVLELGVMSGSGARMVGRTLAAFAIGLPAYSAFLVITRAFYALSDTKTPALVNIVTVVVSSAVGIILFGVVDDPWAIPALALAHSVGALVGVAILSRLLTERLGRSGSPALMASLVRVATGGALAAVAMILVRFSLSDESDAQRLLLVVACAGGGALVYLATLRALKAPELSRLKGVFGRS